MIYEPKCPHCGAEAYVDEGPFGDDNTEEVDCDCGKTYLITSSITISHHTRCLESEHEVEVEVWSKIKGKPTVATCKNCDETFFKKHPRINPDYINDILARHPE